MAVLHLRPVRVVLAILAAVILAAALLLMSSNRDRAEAANACQHYTHTHYHFPYNHRDTHRYDGAHNHGDVHYHHYNNLQHSDEPYYHKNCDAGG